MTRRLFLAMPAVAADPVLNCGPDRMCQAANTFAYQYGEWVTLINTISPASKDFAQREAAAWARQRSAYARLETLRGQM